MCGGERAKKVIYVLKTDWELFLLLLIVHTVCMQYIYYKYYGILLVFLSIIFLFSFFFSAPKKKKRREFKKKNYLICTVNVNGCKWNVSAKQDRIWNICGLLNLKMANLFFFPCSWIQFSGIHKWIKENTNFIEMITVTVKIEYKIASIFREMRASNEQQQ